MKKLLTATAIAAFASAAYAEEGSFYVRGDVGPSWLPQDKVSVKSVSSGQELTYKSSTHVVGSLGLGTYVMDNLRSELELSNHFNPEQKQKELTSNGSKTTSTLKSTAASLVVKGLVDFADLGVAKLFAGAGIGASQVSTKAVYQVVNTASGAVSSTGSAKYKRKTNFTYLGTAGASFDATDGVKLDVAYSLQDHGKSDKYLTEASDYRILTHDVKFGVRVEL
ncbi:MAG: outer membrane beta-barrel protein [Rickettsiaceae bacterium]|nr:outer membrane beta-barrel protein [Rickettsiaceae bacterium]